MHYACAWAADLARACNCLATVDAPPIKKRKPAISMAGVSCTPATESCSQHGTFHHGITEALHGQF